MTEVRLGTTVLDLMDGERGTWSGKLTFFAKADLGEGVRSAVARKDQSAIVLSGR